MCEDGETQARKEAIRKLRTYCALDLHFGTRCLKLKAPEAR